MDRQIVQENHTESGVLLFQHPVQKTSCNSKLQLFKKIYALKIRKKY